MTVLVSVVKQMIADGGEIRAVACASTGDTSAALAAYAAAAGIPAIVILPRGQGLAGAAGAAARQRRARAGARHRLRRLHGDRPAAGRGRRRLPRQLDEQPAPRGPEDAVDRDRAAVRLGGAGRRHHPRRQPRQRQRARRRLRPDARARADRQASAHRRGAGGGGQPALHRLQVELGVRADEGAADAGVGDPDRQPGVDATRRFARSSGSTASSSRRPRASWRTRRRGPIAPACSTARTRRWRWRRSRSWSTRGEISATDRVIVISTANGLKFTEFKIGYHTDTLAGVTPRHANPPVELPNDYDAVRRAIERVDAGRGSALNRGEAKADELEVWKFGGASLADAAAIAKAVALICGHRRPAGDRGLGARRHHRSAARGRRRRDLRPPAPMRAAPRRSSSGAHRDVARALLPPGPARRRLLATIDASAREYQRTVRRHRRAGSPRAARERPAGVARRAHGGVDPRRGAVERPAAGGVRRRDRDHRDRRQPRRRRAAAGADVPPGPRGASCRCSRRARSRSCPGFIGRARTAASRRSGAAVPT